MMFRALSSLSWTLLLWALLQLPFIPHGMNVNPSPPPLSQFNMRELYTSLQLIAKGIQGATAQLRILHPMADPAALLGRAVQLTMAQPQLLQQPMGPLLAAVMSPAVKKTGSASVLGSSSVPTANALQSLLRQTGDMMVEKTVPMVAETVGELQSTFGRVSEGFTQVLQRKASARVLIRDYSVAALLVLALNLKMSSHYAHHVRTCSSSKNAKDQRRTQKNGKLPVCLSQSQLVAMSLLQGGLTDALLRTVKCLRQTPIDGRVLFLGSAAVTYVGLKAMLEDSHACEKMKTLSTSKKMLSHWDRRLQQQTQSALKMPMMEGFKIVQQRVHGMVPAPTRKHLHRLIQSAPVQGLLTWPETTSKAVVHMSSSAVQALPLEWGPGEKGRRK